jgi:hypothetical protein
VLCCFQLGVEERIGLARRSREFVESRFAALQIFIDLSSMREVVGDPTVYLQQRQRRISLDNAFRRLSLKELVDHRFERYTAPDEVVTRASLFDEFLSHCLDYNPSRLWGLLWGLSAFQPKSAFGGVFGASILFNSLSRGDHAPSTLLNPIRPILSPLRLPISPPGPGSLSLPG